MKSLMKYLLRGLIFFLILTVAGKVFSLQLNAVTNLVGTAVFLIFSIACDRIFDAAAKRRG